MAGSFGVWDYVVFISMLLVSASIGIYYRFSGGKQKTIQEYLLADRSMSIIPVSFSLMASFMSAITLIGVSNEIYQFGTQFIVINLSYGLFTPLVTYLYLPVFYKMNVTSVYEYLEKRFGKICRLAASIAFSLQMILYNGIVLFAPAISLEVVTHMNKATAIVVIGVVCTFYSTIGGMKAVLLADVFQSLLMFAAIFAVIISGVSYAGGVAEIFSAADKGGRLELWNFDIDPTVRHSWFSLIIGGGFTYLTLYGVSQTQVQRLLTVKSLKHAQRAVWVHWPILSLLSFSTSFSGLVIYYFYQNCDPLKSGRITTRDQNMPMYVVDAMGHIPGLAGLFVSGIFAAGLSSISSALNSLAAVTVEDYLRPLYGAITKKPFTTSPTKTALISKFVSVFYGAVTIGLAFVAQNLGGVLQASLTIFGVIGGPLLGLFTLGMTSRRANQYGAVLGLFIGISISLWIGFGGPKPPLPLLEFSVENCEQFISNYTAPVIVPVALSAEKTDYFYLYQLSYLYSVVIGFVTTYLMGYVISEILRLFNLQGPETIYVDDEQTVINGNLFMPPLAKRYRKQSAMALEGKEGD